MKMICRFLCAVLCLAMSQAVQYPDAYPTSARPTGSKPLYILSTDRAVAEDVVTVETLAGALGRDTPQIYRVKDEPSDSYNIWLKEMQSTWGVQTNRTFENDVSGLVGHFAPQIRGYVLFEPGHSNIHHRLIHSCHRLLTIGT